MSLASRVFRISRPLLAPAKSAATSSTPATKVPPKSDAAPRKASGILKQVTVSPELRVFLGVPEASRTEAVKKIWAHIKEHQLQNPLNKKEIICDDKLKTIFAQKERVGMLEIAKLLSPHFQKSG
ncbi:Upstream activation factor subunit UAF30 [Linum perenne]